MLRASLRSLRARKLRLLLTGLSIVLGVGFVAGTYVLTDTMNAAFDDLFSSFAVDVDVIVRSDSAFDPEIAGPGGGTETGRETIPETLLEQVQTVPGVAVAYGDVAGYAQMVDPATEEVIGGFGPPTLGVNWSDQSGVAEIRDGQAPVAPDEVAIDAFAADRYEIGVGDRITILFQGPPGEFTVVGIVGFGEVDNLSGATAAAFETDTAQQLLGKEGEFDTISVVADEGVTSGELTAAVQAALPEGLEALTAASVADEQSEALQEGLGFFRTALLVFAAVALFVGAFIIFNTFSIVVAQRTRELALLRALGGSRRQVLTSVILEAIVVGVVASAIGVLAGIGIAVGLQGLLSAFGIDLPSTGIQLKARTIVVAMLVGVVVTVVAAIVPARHAASVAPIQALREPETLARAGRLQRRAVVGAAVVAIGIAALGIGLFARPANAAAVVGLGAALTFVGVAVLSPLAARPVVGGIGAPLRRFGVAARLGRENAMRNPRRTAATASALMIGLGLVAMVAVLGASLKASFDAALEQTLKADYTLTTTSLLPFSPDVAERTRAVDGVEASVPFRQSAFRVDGNTSFLTATDPAAVELVASLEVSEGVTSRLVEPDTVMVFADLAQEQGWTLGSDVPAGFATVGDRPLTIVGIFDENRLVGDYVVSLDTFERYFTEQLDAFVLVKVSPDADLQRVQRDIETAIATYPNIAVQDQAGFREQQAGFINQLLGLVTALLMMAIVIALFGIVNTLGLSIYERTRELGLLRAVGLSRKQTKRMIRWEAVMIAVFGALLGLVVGIVFGWALRLALAEEGVSELAIPGGQLLLYLVFAALAGVLAAIGPARRAAKLSVLDSIAYE
ncbi:MAG: FtsX-like permease family protein [Actinomycetota bacterium]